MDSFGHVQLRRSLDREAAAYHTVRVLAVDSGFPALTATASLLLTVTDVNDNAPHVANPDTLVVPENSGPRHVADLRLDDSDDWSLGHGPPFTVKLDDNAPAHIKKAFAVDFDESKYSRGAGKFRIHTDVRMGEDSKKKKKNVSSDFKQNLLYRISSKNFTNLYHHIYVVTLIACYTNLFQYMRIYLILSISVSIRSLCSVAICMNEDD